MSTDLKPVAVVVYHSRYGCQTGCCGHRIELRDDPEDEDNWTRSAFEFGHMAEGDDPLEFAKRLVTEEFGAEHVKDLAWDKCVIVSSKDCTW